MSRAAIVHRRALLGREPLLEEVRAALRPGRLVTLTGTGGIGKTRMASEIAHLWRGARWFVPFGAVARAEEVPGVVAAALGLRGVRNAEEAVVEALDGGLVILDELERLPGFTPVLARWIEACPDVCWLATSRRALGLPVELLVEVPPLPVPAAPEDAPGPSATLFLRAAGLPAGALSAPVLSRVLVHTGGLPLAIELAAGRLAVLTADSLLRRLDTAYLDTLRDPVATDRALEAVLEQTCAELPPEFVRSLGECTAFAGRFTVDRAEMVLSTGPGALDAMHALTRWHLLIAEAGQLELLTPIRRFAETRIGEAELSAALERHGAWAATHANGLVRRYRREPEAVAELEALAPELYAVLDRARTGRIATAHGIAAGRGLCVLYEVRGPTDGLMSCALDVAALAPEDDAARAAWCDTAVRRAMRLAGESDPRALAAAEAAVAEAERHGDTALRVRARIALGTARHRARRDPDGDLAAARRILEDAAALADSPALRAAAVGELSLVVHDQMQGEAALDLVQQALALAREAGDRFAEARALGLGSTMLLERAQTGEAEVWNQRATRAWAEVGDARRVALAELRGARIAETLGDVDLAERRYLEVEPALQRIQARSLVQWSRGVRGRIALLRGHLDEAEVLLAGWRGGGWNLDPTYHALSATLAAWRGDVALAEEHARESALEPKRKPLGEMAALAAPGFAAPPGSPEARAALARARARWAEDEASMLMIPVGEALLAALEERAGTWTVALDGSWFRPPGGALEDISRRHAATRILAALATARKEGGEALDVDTLFEVGWPGQHAIPRAAANRVYVALSTLRKAGLGDVIVREEGGWQLDAAVPVIVADRAPARTRP